MPGSSNFMTSKEALDFINKIGDIFKGLPHLPKSWVKFFVKITPWLVLIGGIGSIVSAINYFTLMRGMEKVARVFAPIARINPIYYVAMSIAMLILGVLYLKAFGPLRDKKITGWIYLFWAEAISIIQILLGVIFYSQGIWGGVIGTFIGLYMLFEIKKEYN
jgi:hypothetical protein